MADTKISGLAAAGALTGTELAVCVKGGVTSQTTTQAIADLASGSNLGNANLTANAAVRTYTLNGSLATDELEFLNGAGAQVLEIRGDKVVNIPNNLTVGDFQVATGALTVRNSTGVGIRINGDAGVTGLEFYKSASSNWLPMYTFNRVYNLATGLQKSMFTYMDTGGAGNSSLGHDIEVKTLGSANTCIRLDASGATINNAIEIEAGNIKLNTTGVKVGTATTEKLGFWNTTPIVQPTALTASDATATDGTIATNSLIINNLRVRLNELEAKLSTAGGGSGLIA